tara:strand:+ start:547 stop:984 length:438 start_codon:yes stop_codon:yes gene_type:complete
MATRELSHSKVMVGRVVSLTLTKGGTEKLALKGLKDGVVNFSEELKEQVTELEDGNEIIESFGRKYNVEILFSELDTTDLANINGCDALIVATALGGANGTGRTLTMSTLDSCKAHIDGMKTKIVAVKSIPEADNPGFVIADVSA